MKKTFFILTFSMFLIGISFAQTREIRTIENSRSRVRSADKMVDNSRAIIYSEGFENTSSSALPVGWVSIPVVWLSTDTVISGVENPPVAHSGERYMARSWEMAGAFAWAISNGITLTAGKDYTITFWFSAPGYPVYNEYDDFEVRIGQTPTVEGMNSSTLLFSNINTMVSQWTLAECAFVPEVTGTYHLGFHDLNPAIRTGIWIAIDDIEISECLCAPVDNFSVNYNADCSKAELKWDAPTTGTIIKYQILMDDEEIAVVETTSYTDTKFEPTLDHTWSVKVICQEEEAIYRNFYKEACIEPSCKRAKNLTVNYKDCNAAVLEWNAPTDILWDNTDEPTMWVHASVRWMMEEFSRYIMADDFNVPAGETWYITEFFTTGTYSPTSGVNEVPDFIGVEMFYDDNGKPGQQFYEDTFLTPIGGDFGKAMTILLTDPIVISNPGKYWVSIYGVHEKDFADDRYYYLTMTDAVNGPLYHIFDEENGLWEPTTGEQPSLFFRVQGRKTNYDIEYNIYRDGELIKERTTDLTYTDFDFNPALAHKWSVRVACPEGDISSPIYGKLNACLNINEIEPSFVIAPNPANSIIKITTETVFNKVEIINFLGQTVISQLNTDNTIDISNLTNGVYFVRIATDNGTDVQKFVKQ